MKKHCIKPTARAIIDLGRIAYYNRETISKSYAHGCDKKIWDGINQLKDFPYSGRAYDESDVWRELGMRFLCVGDDGEYTVLYFVDDTTCTVSLARIVWSNSNYQAELDKQAPAPL